MAQAISQDDIQKGVNPDAKREASEQPAVTEGDKLIDTHGAYLDSPRNVAKELGVAFVDMNKITHDLVEGMGPVDSRKLFMWVPANQVAAMPKGREDNTHLNVYGGVLWLVWPWMPLPRKYRNWLSMFGTMIL